MEISEFKHKIIEEVKFHEVDMMSICNNAVYLNYYEDARIRYLQEIKKKYQFTEVLEGDNYFITAYNDCNYLEPAFFDEVLNVYTKINYIKNTSFGFKHLVENDRTKRIIAEGTGVYVYIKLSTKQKQQLPQEFYEAVQDFEKDLKIIKE